jgi:hypothetical protein
MTTSRFKTGVVKKQHNIGSTETSTGSVEDTQNAVRFTA